MKSLHMSKKDKLKAIILIILTLCVVAFIFMHSLTPATLSAEESGAVTDWLTKLIPFHLTDHIVRKLAHFTEYSVLGFLTSFTVYSFFKKPTGGIFIKMFVTLFTAVIDETIQLHVPGRSGQVTDVLLDFSGAVTGIIVSTLLILIYLLYKKRKEMKNGRN